MNQIVSAIAQIYNITEEAVDWSNILIFGLILYFFYKIKDRIDFKNISDTCVKEWTKARTVFTFMFYGTFVYMVLHKIPVPPELNTIISTLFGFWFGQRQSSKINGNGGAK